jgi:hypothetical protein
MHPAPLEFPANRDFNGGNCKFMAFGVSKTGIIGGVIELYMQIPYATEQGLLSA